MKGCFNCGEPLFSWESQFECPDCEEWFCEDCFDPVLDVCYDCREIENYE